MIEDEHYLAPQDYREEYNSAKETEIINKALGQDPPDIMKIPFSGRHDLLAHSVKVMFPAAASILIVDQNFRGRDGAPFMIEFPLSPSWRGRVAQSIRSFRVTAFIEGGIAYLKITRRGEIHE